MVIGSVPGSTHSKSSTLGAIVKKQYRYFSPHCGFHSAGHATKLFGCTQNLSTPAQTASWWMPPRIPRCPTGCESISLNHKKENPVVIAAVLGSAVRCNSQWGASRGFTLCLPAVEWTPSTRHGRDRATLHFLKVIDTISLALLPPSGCLAPPCLQNHQVC